MIHPRPVAVLRVVVLAFAVLCAALLLERLWRLSSSAPRVRAPESALADGAAETTPRAGILDPVREPPAPLRAYETLAVGVVFTFTNEVVAARAPAERPGEPPDGPAAPDRFGELTITGVVWDEALARGLASLVLDSGERGILAPGERIGEYRVIDVARDGVEIEYAGERAHLRPRPPVLEKTHTDAD